ncbi:MAG: glycoside hydrolase family 9 protein [Ruminococcus sp.]|nr:glycoside hydrolase family 9 protein [Ruminococcus sp.]
MKLTKKIAAAAASAAIAVSSIPVAALNTSAADHNYMEALAMSLYFFDSNACGSGITGGPLTWRGNCHTYDAEASVGDLDGSAKAFVDPDGDGKVDVSGGWHDAGDHIKFNLTIGFALSSLGISDYINPGIYEKAGCRDHLEYEMRWGADYLMKTTFLDDSGKVVAVAHTVADGGTDHSFWSSPEVQTYERPIFWLTANDNNSSVSCEMAAGLGAAAYVFKDSDPEYSAKCAKYAKALLEFGTKHVGNNTGGIGGFYSTDAQYQDEEAIAQAWLWIVGEGDKPTRVPKNKDYGGSQYDGWVYSWDKVWQGYATLMYKATGDSAFRDELIVEIDGQGGMKVGKYNTNGWGTSRINCAIQMDAYTVADGDPNSEYAQGAKWQLDYILGDNNLGYSFLLGFGDKWPVHIHHRAANPGGDGITSAQNPAAKYTNYGMLVGGIDANGYEDHADRYQYTEGALDYNGCFAIASACAANLFGGDATTFDAIKNSAAEINADFKFADESVTPPEDNPPSSNPPTDIVYGDANCDGNVTIADSAAILQFLGNSDKYFLSEQGELNADVNGQAGITPDDALVIQRVDAGMISVNDLPLTQ